MLKKFLATALAAAMILGFAGIASAASFTDTAGIANEAAVDQLAGLGLLKGYGDGTFRPDNPVTRAEFAKVIVSAMGMEQVATMLEGAPSGFADVASNHWASGFISLASSQGIIKGYPDGTFQPEADVSYVESLAMIIRALGYEPVVTGTWPTNYVTKAFELGLHPGVTFTADAPATRVNISRFVVNALGVDKLVPDAVGDIKSYKVAVGETLLKAMGYTSVPGWLVESPESLSTASKTTITLDDGVARTLAAGATANGLLGHKVSAWIKDGKVYFIQDLTPADSVKVAEYVGGTSAKVGTKTYTAADFTDPCMIDNYGALKNLALPATGEISLIFDGTAIKYVLVNDYDYGVVNTVDLTYKTIAFSAGSTGLPLNLKDVAVSWNGAASSLDELKKGDILEYIPVASAKAVIHVTRQTVDGVFSRELTTGKVVVGGVTYEPAGYATGIVAGLLGNEVTLVLNKSGQVVSMKGSTPAATVPKYLAVVTQVGTRSPGGFDADVNIIKVLNADGTKPALDLASTVTAPVAGDIIEYELNDKGVVSKITPQLTFAALNALGVGDELAINKNLALVNTKKVTADTVVFDIKITAGAFTSATVKTTAGLLGITTGTEVGKEVVASGVNLKLVATVGATYAADVSDVKYGVVTGSYKAKYDANTQKWVLQILGSDGVEKTYWTDLGDTGAVDKDHIEFYTAKKVITYKVQGEDAVALDAASVPLTLYTKAGTDEAMVASIDLTNNVLGVVRRDAAGAITDGPNYHWITSKTIVFNLSGPATTTIDTVGVGAKIDVYLTTSSEVQILVLK